MREARADIWSFPPTTPIVITTNGIVKKNGEAVMDKGCALEAPQSSLDSPASSPEPAQGESACVGSADRDPANCISQGCINAGRCLFTNHEGRE